MKIDVAISAETIVEVSAARIRSKTVEFANAVATVGDILDAQGKLTSIYPNEIRYGDTVINFPSRSLALAATAIVAFAQTHWETLRE